MSNRVAQVALVALTTAGSSVAFLPLSLPIQTRARRSEAASAEAPPGLARSWHQHQRPSALLSVALFGLGGGGSSSKSSSAGGAPALLRARKTVEKNAAFKARTEQYARGAITAIDYVGYLERDVASKVSGCDLEDVVAAALDKIPDKRKRDLLSKASGGRAIGPGGSMVSGGSRGGEDVVVNGRSRQYVMSQGGQRISSGKSTICNGVEVGKEGAPLKLKVITRSNSALAKAEVANVELIGARNGASALSRHFVGFVECVDNYNGRGDIVMVMRAESMDLRKLAEGSGGGVAQGKLRKYSSEMASIIRCIHKAGLVWTDLKLDNMVLCGGGKVKAIDLEGAVPARSAPKSFSPPSTPPDFIGVSRGGYAGVTVDRSFDVWSLGMAILHLYLGRGYFEGSNDPQIIAKLGQPGFAVDLSGVRDSRTRGVLQGLLDPDPQKRLKYFESPLGRLALL